MSLFDELKFLFILFFVRSLLLAQIARLSAKHTPLPRLEMNHRSLVPNPFKVRWGQQGGGGEEAWRFAQNRHEAWPFAGSSQSSVNRRSLGGRFFFGASVPSTIFPLCGSYHTVRTTFAKCLSRFGFDEDRAMTTCRLS